MLSHEVIIHEDKLGQNWRLEYKRRTINDYRHLLNPNTKPLSRSLLSSVAYHLQTMVLGSITWTLSASRYRAQFLRIPYSALPIRAASRAARSKTERDKAEDKDNDYDCGGKGTKYQDREHLDINGGDRGGRRRHRYRSDGQ
ncbi:hypothetical protein KQX54_006232 [Cotesia glomerata]|uniref:Uncharacterized protein n=1 Tax=Cotesia glomerata TaxID=32391 RepID=A0AAV7I9I4_COTGL|nr:hypothetical protein KQX54_006232 [Cotesia glomerata]